MKPSTKPVDDKAIKAILLRENKFIIDLFAALPVPSHLQTTGMDVIFSQCYCF